MFYGKEKWLFVQREAEVGTFDETFKVFRLALSILMKCRIVFYAQSETSMYTWQPKGNETQAKLKSPSSVIETFHRPWFLDSEGVSILKSLPEVAVSRKLKYSTEFFLLSVIFTTSIHLLSRQVIADTVHVEHIFICQIARLSFKITTIFKSYIASLRFFSERSSQNLPHDSFRLMMREIWDKFKPRLEWKIYLIYANILPLISHNLQFLIGCRRVWWRYKIRTQLLRNVDGNTGFCNKWCWCLCLIICDTNRQDCGFLTHLEQVEGNIWEQMSALSTGNRLRGCHLRSWLKQGLLSPGCWVELNRWML